MKKHLLHIIFLGLIFLIPISSTAQSKKNVWKTLSLMKFERQFSENDGIGAHINSRRYTPILEAMDGDEIEVKGYFVPLDGMSAQSNFMFSAYPYNMCFFCGNAGPESVMEVFTKNEKKVKYSEELITLKGIFRFNAADENGLMYSLENAVQIQ